MLGHLMMSILIFEKVKLDYLKNKKTKKKTRTRVQMKNIKQKNLRT